jgi:hypothetical protein
MLVPVKSLIVLCVSGLLTSVLLLAAQTTKTPSLAPKNSSSPFVTQPWMGAARAKMETELIGRFGEAQQERIRRGLKQVAGFWQSGDGAREVFESFVRANFVGDQAMLDVVFKRYEFLMEKLNGHMTEISRHFRVQTELDLGPIFPFDELFAAYDPSAHIQDDFFRNKLAFVVLLNFPLTRLEDRLTQGETWTRRQWAEVRLAQIFSKRIPAEINLAIAQAASESERYISDYNIWMHHLVNAEGVRIFPERLRLLSHWNLRDEIKANYGDASQGLVKQRMILQVMDRIVTQTIPESVIDNPAVDWNPVTNEVRESKVKDYDSLPRAGVTVSNAPEPDRRYAVWLQDFRAARLMDPYSPTAPTLIARRFDENREIPEPRVKGMFEKVLGSPLVSQIGALIEKRLGRPLEPFDIWYNGFRPRGRYTEAELDQIVSQKYPDAEAYRKDIPNMLVKLGFTPERAETISRLIAVDPARGSGHAMGAGMHDVQARLRTRVEKTGMNYKGYNIAVHEMGHNVEQTISMNDIDHFFLQGVPNTAFTEALAFVFQARDLELLGLTSPAAEDEALNTLNDFWSAYEIAGVALVDMAVWHWMYDHPQATPAQLKVAVLNSAKSVWNQYYAPVFQKKDLPLLAIYSHMINSFLYLPDYPLGHLIAFQIEEQIRKAGSVGHEFERMARNGNIAPDLWMEKATGAPVGPEALLAATERALKELGR